MAGRQNLKTRFRAHETFFIRKGWLRKGLKYVASDPMVFRGTNENPMDVLGIGSNMVKSLRFWMQATGLTEEPESGRRGQIITPLGEMVNQFDPYFEEMGTLWLIHHQLAKNRRNATAWYYFFNEFRLSEFSKDDFTNQIMHQLKMLGEDVSIRSIEDDFNCIVNTYIPRAKLNPGKASPEGNIDCPLGELGLLGIADKKEKTFKKVTPLQDELPVWIALAFIIDQAQDSKEIKISTLQTGVNSIGCVCNLDIIALTEVLHRIELLGLIKVERTAGLNVVRINTDMTYLECVERYYNSLSI